MPKRTENISFLFTMKCSAETAISDFRNDSLLKAKREMKRTVAVYFRYHLCTYPLPINQRTIKIIPPQHHQTNRFCPQQSTETISLVLVICTCLSSYMSKYLLL